jgi:glycosyltransferase involved in cell wall biosynthesis
MEYAIQSMYFVIKTIPNAHLTIIGDGPLHDSLSQLIKEMNLINNVTLMGLLPHRDILQYLQKSHIFLQPSLSEGFSNALLEAMGCGLPIVATPDASEVISKWHNGYIVPYKDARSIADAIIRISCNDEIVLFSHRSIEASKYYTWNSVAKQYLEQFQNIIKKSF